MDFYFYKVFNLILQSAKIIYSKYFFNEISFHHQLEVIVQ